MSGESNIENMEQENIPLTRVKEDLDDQNITAFLGSSSK